MCGVDCPSMVGIDQRQCFATIPSTAMFTKRREIREFRMTTTYIWYESYRAALLETDELATLAQLQEQTAPRTFGFTSRRNNNGVCLQNCCSYFSVHRSAARQWSVGTCPRTRYSASCSRQYLRSTSEIGARTSPRRISKRTIVLTRTSLSRYDNPS